MPHPNWRSRPIGADVRRFFDSVPTGIALRAVHDDRRFHNRRLREYLGSATTGAALEQLIRHTERVSLQRLRKLGTPDRGFVPDLVPPTAQMAGAVSYRIGTALVAEGPLSAERTVVITVERLTPEPMSDEMLRRRFRLSTQEIRVARRLALGCPNARIARELAISVHTTRRHTEKVLRKLGARSRSEVGARLLAIG